MNLLTRSLYAYQFLHIVNRMCLTQSVSCLSHSAASGNVLTSTPDKSLRSCNFEIFGTVQDVYFRQHTQQQAKKLHLVGWVQNTEDNTVLGHMEGQETKIDEMKDWLQTTGSPKSKINKAEFTDEKSIAKLTTDTFDIRR